MKKLDKKVKSPIRLCLTDDILYNILREKTAANLWAKLDDIYAKDDDMIAHVGDFGLSRFLSEFAQTISLGVKGSIGYIAPEYAMGGKASTRGDVYSYGILLLEMITGKGPTDDMFKGNLSLHHFAKLALPERVMEIVDPYLFEDAEVTQGSGNHINAGNKIRDCLILMVRIGVLCSLESPRERMEMKNVVMEMHAIKDSYLRSEFTKIQVRSPLWGEATSYLSHYCDITARLLRKISKYNKFVEQALDIYIILT
ncbi:probable LRR receptor-like serine/threonine-protein kinase At3g47570 [Magnolia sinica]|uniref:probable LRR receptor-like serine/threonine-protein kinase At3g47570 n=1 Tax=Magnolia sinica TaxID=86752 RepID=UPI00265AEB1E|nr:probable LRR receptor-like serine/threonine-protein kinase At3g47570 [Magnolia sinica]